MTESARYVNIVEWSEEDRPSSANALESSGRVAMGRTKPRSTGIYAVSWMSGLNLPIATVGRCLRRLRAGTLQSWSRYKRRAPLAGGRFQCVKVLSSIIAPRRRPRSPCFARSFAVATMSASAVSRIARRARRAIRRCAETSGYGAFARS